MLIHLFMPHLATMHGGPTFWPLNVLVAAISQPGIKDQLGSEAFFIWIVKFKFCFSHRRFVLVWRFVLNSVGGIICCVYMRK